MEEKILKQLKKVFPDAEIKIIIDQLDGAHVVLDINSSKFKNLSLVDQHRLVYDTLADLIKDGTIHALKLKTHA